MLIFRNICIRRASTMKKQLLDAYDTFWIQRDDCDDEYNDNEKKILFAQVFQIYQSRFLGLCIYRSLENDDDVWDKLFNKRKNKIQMILNSEK